MSDELNTTMYQLIGGEPTIRKLVQRFYELMDTLPEAEACRAIHGPSLAPAEEKLYEYLTGWLGGPPLFTDKYGAPMLRARHLRAPIGGAEISGWLICFGMALDETIENRQIREALWPQIHNLAQHMRNREG